MDIRTQIEEIRDILAASVERGAWPHITRAYVLVENLLEQFFHDPEDRVELPPEEEEHVYLSLRPEDSFAGPPLPPAA
jgi:hypothetical protein